MKQDISVSSKFPNNSSIKTVGTHPGIFHEDDVVACALFCILNCNSSVRIIRSRDFEVLSKCETLVDIGGGQYDHHQIGGNGKRENGVPFASAGLFWKKNGKDIIKLLISDSLNDSFQSYELSIDELETIFISLDNKIIQEIDKIDNGIPAKPTPLDFITSFLPNWRNVSIPSCYDISFQSVLEITIPVLKQLILTEIDKTTSFYYLLNQFRTNIYSRILEIPSQTFPWLEAVISINKNYNGNIDFVIFNYPSGGWAAQCVPPSLDEKFKQRVHFPKSWAGQTINLPTISGIADATFCHNGLFFIKAQTKDSIIAMCNIAINT